MYLYLICLWTARCFCRALFDLNVLLHWTHWFSLPSVETVPGTKKRDKLRQLTSRALLQALFNKATQLDEHALGGLGFEDHQRMRWGKSPKATDSEGWVWRSWVWIPKPARIFLVKSTSITTHLLFSFVYPILCGRLSIFASLWVQSCRSHILKK